MKNPIQWLRFASRPVIIPLRRLGSTLNDQKCKSVRAKTECEGALESVVGRQVRTKMLQIPRITRVSQAVNFPRVPLARSPEENGGGRGGPCCKQLNLLGGVFVR